MAYEGTSVAVERSQGDIRKLLVRHSADGFEFGEGDGLATVSFRAVGYVVRMRVALKQPTDDEVRRRRLRTRGKTFEVVKHEVLEQEARRIWRVLHWVLKSRLEAVEERVETFEEAFLPHLVDPKTDRTLFETLKDAGGLLQLNAGNA